MKVTSTASNICKVLSAVEYITGKEKVKAGYVPNKKEMEKKREIRKIVDRVFPENFSCWDDSFVAVCDGMLVGFLTFSNLNISELINFDRILHDYAASWHPIAGYEIALMGVDDKWRKRGIAKEMLYKLFELCPVKEKCLYTLYVRKKNIPARNLYKKLGFKELYTLRGYYSHTEHIMGEDGCSHQLGERVVEDDAIYMATVV